MMAYQEFLQSQPQTSKSFFPSGSVPVTNGLDMLGYEISTTLEERMNAQKERLSRRKETEYDRRRRLKNDSKRLNDEVTSSPSEKLSLKKCLGKAIRIIKDLKYESGMLMAERYWFLLENRELAEYLQYLQECHGIRRKPELWEDGRTIQDWRDSKWDEIPKGRDEKLVRFLEMYTNFCLENVRKQKMQLHEKYVSTRTDSGDAVQCKMETEGWCSDRRCPAAPHRIQHRGGMLERGDAWWVPLPEEEGEKKEDEDDDGWLEDDDKMELVGNCCPVQSSHLTCNCSKKNSKTTNDVPDVKKKKRKKHKDHESKNGSDASALKVVLDKNIFRLVSVSAKASDEPRTKVSKDTGTASIADGSKVNVEKVIKLNPLDPSLANRQLYLLQVGKNLGEKTQKIVNPKSKLEMNLVPVSQGKALLVFNPSKHGVAKLVSIPTSVGHSQPMATISKPQVGFGSGKAQVGGQMVSGPTSVGKGKPKTQVVFGSLGATGLNSLTGKVQVDGKVVSTLGLGKQTVTVSKPQVVFGLGSTTGVNSQMGNAKIDGKVVSSPPSVGQGRPTATLIKPQAFAGYVSKRDIMNSPKGKTQADALSRPTNVAHYQHTVFLGKPQAVGGSGSTTGLDSWKEMAQVTICKPKIVKGDVKMMSEPTNVGHGQRAIIVTKRCLPEIVSDILKPTDIKGKHRVITVSANADHDSKKRKAQADGKAKNVKAKVRHSQPRETKAKHQAAPGSVSVTGWDFSKGNVEVDVRMVSGKPHVSYSQPAGTQVRHLVDPGGATELDSREGKTHAHGDPTEETDKSSSPISCMLCDRPFNNVAELQSHLIKSHAS